MYLIVLYRMFVMQSQTMFTNQRLKRSVGQSIEKQMTNLIENLV